MTREMLLAILNYNHLTGQFTWASQVGHVTPGKIAGSLNSCGYVRIGISGKDYRAHRLAWLYMTGEMPNVEIDHINRNRKDNRWANLRLATTKQNRENLSLRKRNKTGLHGVSWCADRKKWHAQIQNNSKTMNLGRFDCFFEAVCARKSAETKYFTHSYGLGL